jgi:glycosyltransferase involved in cell wall biosynthesis
MFFALTEFARQKFVAAGLPSERIMVKPNYAPPTLVPRSARRGALFVGRLSLEKGIDQLLEAWRTVDYPLTVVGDGPLARQLAASAPSNVQIRGPLDAAGVAEEMSRAAFLVVPSIWYEMLPMVIIEAFAAGLPVLGSRIGGLAETIGDDVNGRHFAAGDVADMARVVRDTASDPAALERMGTAARSTYEARYSAAAVYRAQMAGYERVLEMARPAKQAG